MIASSSRPLPLSKRLILIVDDDVATTDALVELLGHRYDVVVARDGMEGVEKATTFSPHLIITDVTMPRLDGLAMVRIVRSRLRRKVPFIFLTGRDSPSDVVAGIGAGARHYLTKPVNAADLERHIERALGI